jgi:hypothetical protein
VDISAFRQKFPAFADETAYSDELLNIWFNDAGEYLREGWALSGARYDLACQLMAAHLMTLAYNGIAPNAQGAVAGTGGAQVAGGPIVSATEGGVSVSFAPPPVKTAWQQWLASSSYGLQLWALLRVAGAGGVYLGGLGERSAFRRAYGVQR